MSLSVDPTRYDSCSSVVSSEAAVCHNNCASVSLTDPFMYGFLDSTDVCFDTLMQQAYGSTLLQSDGGHSESVWYPLGMKQYYNISIYCNICFCNTIQYGLKEISIYCTLQYIVIYCNILQCLLS